MSLIQSEFTKYSSVSQDEIMLKELERRDGIYSFIFHELETPKDISALEKSKNKELQKYFEQQLLLVDERCQSDEADGDKQQVQHSCNTEVATLANVTTKLSASTQKPQPTILPSTYSTLINSKMIATTTTAATSPSNDCSYGISSSNKETFKKSTCETWQPPTCLSMPRSLQSCSTHLSRMYDQPRLGNFLSTSVGFRVRVATPRFSHISVPMVRNRRHALKETPDYKNYNKCIDRVADLRQLFPYDPDVHAPFAEMSTMEAMEEENKKLSNNLIKAVMN